MRKRDGISGWALGVLAAALVALAPAPSSTSAPAVTEGNLTAVGDAGEVLGRCPLEHTDVEVRIAGPIAHIVVTQLFSNPYPEKIEAVYTFPLGARAAVDDMTMRVGDRLVRGLVKPRDEARWIYDEARAQGHVASLLDEERPNIFTQSVANIEPGKQVEIRIRYTETLTYEDGTYSFVFPMVVGPRYIPQGGGVMVPASAGPGRERPASDSHPVPDAPRITPPVTPQGIRAGHDIKVRVEMDAGVEIRDIRSRQHEIETHWLDRGHRRARVGLARRNEIPNKDFILEFATSTERIEDALLAFTDERGGFFTLVIEPPRRVMPQEIVPREVIFVIDTSGSQRGFPLEISRAIMRRAIWELGENDTYNLITFAGGTRILWSEARANTAAHRREALAFLDHLEGRGGTEMMKAIHAALGGAHDPEKVRIVAFFTDGYVGNDMEIVDAVKRHARTTRVFSFGIGTSVNRYLLDSMARAGRGEVEYALNPSEAEKAADRFYERVEAPVLTDISLDWGELADHVMLEEIYPQLIPDLFSVKPVVVKGKYRPGRRDLRGEITVYGRNAEGAFERAVEVTLPSAAGDNTALAPLWARAKVEHLMDLDLLGLQRGRPDPEIKQAIIELGLQYRLLTKYTSFVAVEERTITAGGEPRTIQVPVEMPEGVSYEGVFGEAVARRSGSGAVMGMVGRSAPSLGLCLKKLTLCEDEADGGSGTPPRISPSIPLPVEKLDSSLRDLASRLDRAGNYQAGNVTVREGRVEVAVYLAGLDEETVTKLEELGFEELLRSPAVGLIIGTVEVEKLRELARLAEVRHIAPPSYGS